MMKKFCDFCDADITDIPHFTPGITLGYYVNEDAFRKKMQRKFELCPECKEALLGMIGLELDGDNRYGKEPSTDLTDKCGSCRFASDPVQFSSAGGYSYVYCQYPDRKFRTSMAHLKQRTCRRCSLYEVKEDEFPVEP